MIGLKNMKRFQIIVCLLLLLLNKTFVFSQKKVYADYHGVRKTRAYDGEFGEWRYYSKITNNATGINQLTYNPDLIGDGDRHEIAAAHYPLVGMQSQFDPDYIEYQVLSAKSAGIDGFFVEWGYMAHGSNALLQKIQEVARKYNFEVGVNICDGWLMNKKWYPGTRPEKLQYFLSCMQYLIDNVFTGPTAPLVNGNPVFYLFHDGFTESEFSTVRKHPYTYPENYPVSEGNKFPQVIMRTTLNPSLSGGVYTPKSPITQAGSWINNNRVVPTPWIPERIRNAGSSYPGFNKYATADDCIKFLKAFNDNVWTMGFTPAAGLVTPGMNNYGCAGWSPTGTLYIIPREEGDSYKQMWEYQVQNKESLDMVYIASWSDYTEGHEIEPTVENGFRELKTTLKYASQFKGDADYDESGINLSYELFLLRKKLVFFQQCGIDCSGKDLALDEIAQKISEKQYAEANTLLRQEKQNFTFIENNIRQKQYTVDDSQISITGIKNDNNEYILSGSRTSIIIRNADLKAELASKNYEGYLLYEYWDDTWGRNTYIVSGTDSEPSDVFKFVAQIKDKGLKQWRNAKIRLYKQHVKYGSQPLNSDFSFYGDGAQSSKIRNVRFEFTVFNPLNTNSDVLLSDNRNKITSYQKGNYLCVDLNRQKDSNIRLHVFSTNGVKVFTGNFLGSKMEIDISGWQRGVYILSVTGGNLRHTSKFVY